MSEGALDLSISSYDTSAQRSARSHDQVSSDSGRASTDSTSSEAHDDLKQRLMTSPHVAASSSGIPASAPVGAVHTVPLGLAGLEPTEYPPPVHLRDLPTMPPHASQHPRSVSSSSSPPRVNIPGVGSLSNPNSPEAATSSLIPGEDEFKPVLPPLSSGTIERSSDARVAPIRPFKMYPVDPYNVYGSNLMPGSSGGLSPSQMGIQSLYDSGSPSSFPSFPLTPLTSHLLQRKRRLENRDNGSSSANSVRSSMSLSIASPSSSTIHSTASSFNGQTTVTTSVLSPGSLSRNENSNGSESDGDKKPKLLPDEKKDDAYWDRRRKNNEAAKRSRDARRQKEEEIAMRAAFLEQENLKLRAQVAILKNETAKLHYMLYNRI